MNLLFEKMRLRPLSRFASGVFALCIFIFAGIVANAADSTSFNPRTVSVTAKSISGVPVGTVVAWPATTNPPDMENWLDCNGQLISQAAYPDLYAVIGATVPNYQGMFLRGHGSQSHVQNNGSMVGATSTTHQSGALGQVQGDGTRDISGEVAQVVFRPPYASYSTGLFSYRSVYPGLDVGGKSDDFAVVLSFNSSRVTPTATENRPINKAVRYLIRARP